MYEWEIFRNSFELGNSIGDLFWGLVETTHKEDFDKACSIYSILMSEDNTVEFNLNDSKQAIYLLNSIDNTDKLYVQFAAWYFKTIFYFTLNSFDKCYECLNRIETKNEGDFFTLKKELIKKIKSNVPQLRKTIKQAEEEWRQAVEEQKRIEEERKNRELDLYNRVVAIDNSVNETIKQWDEAIEKQKKRDVELNAKISRIDESLQQIQSSAHQSSDKLNSDISQCNSILLEIKDQLSKNSHNQEVAHQEIFQSQYKMLLLISIVSGVLSLTTIVLLLIIMHQ